MMKKFIRIFIALSILSISYSQISKDEIKIDEFPLELVDNIFSRDETVYVALVVHENKYFVIQYICPIFLVYFIIINTIFTFSFFI